MEVKPNAMSAPNRAPGRPTVLLYDLDFAGVSSLLQNWDEPAYRARQLREWLYVNLAESFDQMTSLPSSLRERLASETTVGLPKVVATQASSDGQTAKHLLQLADGETIEAVLMRYKRRCTACISTQVGCPVGCIFCATGQAGFRRDLSSGEIVAQALHLARVARAEGKRLSNVVLMGMGEPLLNYDPSVAAIRRLIDPEGFNLGQRHITLSTVGIVPGIDQLAGEGLQITLAISLHAATDDLRDRLVPVNRRYPVNELLAACQRYVTTTGQRISFEWALIAGVNDSQQQAEALAARLAGLPSHVNLIPLNPIRAYGGQPSSRQTIDTFVAVLERNHIPMTVRVRRGAEIQAGCGQLSGIRGAGQVTSC